MFAARRRTTIHDMSRFESPRRVTLLMLGRSLPRKGFTSRVVGAVILAALSVPVQAQTCTDLVRLDNSTSSNGDSFGYSVALTSNTTVVGAPFDTSAGVGVGAGVVSVFGSSGGTWNEMAHLVGTGVRGGDEFGSSVAVDGDLIIVGGPFHDVTPGGREGGAWAFRRVGTTWIEDAFLSPPVPQLDAHYGIAVALSGNTTIVGASEEWQPDRAGSAYVLIRDATAWSLQARLHPSDPLLVTGDMFGSAVALDADLAVVGSAGRNSARSPGQVYVFRRTNVTWVEEAILSASDGFDGDRFGMSVDVSGETIVVGANSGAGLNNPVGSGPSAAYTYEHGPTGWTETAKLSSPQVRPDENFGAAVSIEGDLVLVGAPSNGLQAGEAYFFKREGNAWVSHGIVSPRTSPPSTPEWWFGGDVSLAQPNALIGAPSNATGFEPLWVGRAFIVGEPNEPGEVSGAASGVPLLLRRLDSEIELSFEDLGPSASSYGVEVGVLPYWYSHQGVECNLTPAAGAGRLRTVISPRAGGEYFLVTASQGCWEGPCGVDSMGVPLPAGTPGCTR